MKLAPRLVLVACAVLAAAATAAIAQPDGRQRGDRNQSGQQNGGNPLPDRNDADAPSSNIIATFYSQPGFRGAPITISRPTPDMDSVNFSDVARSARVTGDWQVCDLPNFRGRCRTINGFVEDLAEVGLDRAISSARPSAFASPGPDRQRGQSQYDDDDRRGRVPSGRDDDDDDRGRGGYGRDDDDDRRGPPYASGRPDRLERHEGRTVVFFPNPTLNGQPVVAFNRTAADMFCRRQRLGPAVYFDTASRGRGIGFDERVQLNVPILRDVVCRRQ